MNTHVIQDSNEECGYRLEYEALYEDWWFDDAFEDMLPAEDRPDYYGEMIFAMVEGDYGVAAQDDEDSRATRMVENADYWAKEGRDSFTHSSRRRASKTRAFYKKQSRKLERRAGRVICESF